MSYNITAHTKRKAAALGVTVKPSQNKGKKIDVFKGGEKVASVGALGYKDYGTFLKEDKELAERRKKAYHVRHAKDEKVVGSPGYYAAKLLW
jgi:hypothetical protein